MNLKKKIITLVLLILSAAGAFAMGRSQQKTSAEAAPVTITDVTGRTVTLDKPATRVVGTHNPTMNIAVILGGGGRYIVGFGNKNMAGGLYGYVFPELEAMTQIGTGNNINFETVLQLSPDLAILPERFANLVDQFEAIGIPVAVTLPNNESFETIKNSITLMGVLLGENKQAQKINAFFDSKVKVAKEVSQKVSTTIRAVYLGSSTPLSVANGVMLQSVMLETVGAINVAKDVPGAGGFIDVSLEEMIKWDPEVIYIPTFAQYSLEDILNDPAWGSIKAIRDKRVFVFPSTLEPWDYPTPSTAMGLTWLLHNLYPERYSLDQVIADAKEYYQLVYGQSFSAEQLGLR